MKKQILLFTIILLFSNIVVFSQNEIVVKGKVFDSENHKPLPYVNIGIFEKNIGTVTNFEGEFEMVIPKKYFKDSLTFSYVGYRTKKIYIPELQKNKTSVISLQKKTVHLSEVVIKSKELKERIKGNKSESDIGLAISEFLGYGSEIGAVIKLPHKSVIIKDFNFHINLNNPDSAKFRLKIYSYNKRIDTLIIDKNIIFTLKNHYTGNYKIDLRKYNIIAKGNIFVSLECLEEYTKGYNSKIKNDKYFYDRIIISATLFGSKSFVREVSQGKWQKPEMSKSPGFWLTVLY